VDAGAPRLRYIYFSHIRTHNFKYAAGFLYELAEMPLENSSLNDISISDEADSSYPEMADGFLSMSQACFFIRKARLLRIKHVELTGQCTSIHYLLFVAPGRESMGIGDCG